MASTKPDRPLSNKQAAFVREYIKDFSASGAARRAGYSEKNSGLIGHQMLKKPIVADAIKSALAEVRQQTKITRDWLIAQAMEIMGEAKIDRAHAAAKGSLELIAKLSGQLIERRETRQVTDWSDLSEEELRALAVADQNRVEEGKTRH